MGGKRVVKPRWHRKQTPETKRIVELLEPAFPNHPPDYPPAAYRFNSAPIRVRIVDESFRAKSCAERDEMVAPLLEQLPEETYTDIMILLLLTPEEVDESLMNMDFENPAPSRI